MTLIGRLRDTAKKLVGRISPVHIGNSPPLMTEWDCAAYLLSMPAVALTLDEAGVDAKSSLTRVLQSRPSDTEVSNDALTYVARNLPEIGKATARDSRPPPPLDVRAYGALIVLGSEEFRAAASLPGSPSGKVPFFLAHGAREEQLRDAWPATPVGVEIVNDSYTPMEFVTAALESDFGIAAEEVIRAMFKIHNLGAVTFQVPQNAHTFCVETNTAWRNRGVPLYCRPAVLGDA
jgi:ATP-dependent Clp protease adapter protein ClpS